jgi:hypothetical protein
MRTPSSPSQRSTVSVKAHVPVQLAVLLHERRLRTGVSIDKQIVAAVEEYFRKHAAVA